MTDKINIHGAIRRRFREIEEEIMDGADPESFKKELDRLLDEEVADRDPEAEAAYESVRGRV